MAFKRFRIHHASSMTTTLVSFISKPGSETVLTPVSYMCTNPASLRLSFTSWTFCVRVGISRLLETSMPLDQARLESVECTCFFSTCLGEILCFPTDPKIFFLSLSSCKLNCSLLHSFLNSVKNEARAASMSVAIKDSAAGTACRAVQGQKKPLLKNDSSLHGLPVEGLTA